MFELMQRERLAEVHCASDPDTGLRAVIAIHSTRLGPALGGCRFLPYDHFDHALLDAARLARGMSYKAAMAGLEQGGGKAVLMAPSGPFDRERLFEAFGRVVQTLGGRYITAMDSGTTPADMDAIARHTPHVTSTSSAGDPSPWTAQGVLAGMRAAVHARLGSPRLHGLRVAVQGLGNVGMALVELLHAEGAELIVADMDYARAQRAMERTGASLSTPKAIHQAVCDVFAPCALGAVLNPRSIRELHCAVVAGSANNQLAELVDGDALSERGILYSPDYIINAGGLIYAALNHRGESQQNIRSRVDAIGTTLAGVFQSAAEAQTSTARMADHLAERRLAGEEPPHPLMTAA